MTKKPRISREIAVYTGLFIFGIAYNALIDWLERKRMLEGFTAYAVALGVTVTVGGVSLTDRQGAVRTFTGFIASGLPMILGATWRYIVARRREQDYVKSQTVALRRGAR